MIRPGHRLALAALAASVLTLTGCFPAVSTPAPNPLSIDAGEYDRIFVAAQLVLRREGFELDQISHRFGRVSTRPLLSPTFFEPWKPSNTTAYQALVSTLNEQRRIVLVSLEPAPPAPSDRPQPSGPVKPLLTPGAGSDAIPGLVPAGSYVLRVEVEVEQLRLPTRRLVGPTSASRIFRNLSAVPAEEADRGIAASYWQAVSRDPYLEQRLLAAIIRRSVDVTEQEMNPGPDDQAPMTSGQ